MSSRIFFLALPALLTCCWGIWAPGVAIAQTSMEQPALGPDGHVGGWLGLGTGGTMLRGESVQTLLPEVHVQLSPTLRVGLQGTTLLRGVRTSPDDAPDRSEVRLGYAGIRVEWYSDWRNLHLRPGVVLGGATARLRSTLLDQEVGSRNFIFLEPQIRRSLFGGHRLRADAMASYRIPLGSPSLPGLSVDQLRGGSVGLIMEVYRAP